MRKLLLLAAMLAMVLVVAAPAMAQTAIAGDLDSSVDVVFVDSDVTQTATATQFGGDAIAVGDGSAAAVSNELTVEQSAVVAGFDSVAAGGDLDGDGILDDFEFVLFFF